MADRTQQEHIQILVRKNTELIVLAGILDGLTAQRDTVSAMAVRWLGKRLDDITADVAAALDGVQSSRVRP